MAPSAFAAHVSERRVCGSSPDRRITIRSISTRALIGTVPREHLHEAGEIAPRLDTRAHRATSLPLVLEGGYASGRIQVGCGSTTAGIGVDVLRAPRARTRERRRQSLASLPRE
jgi:hypothetical protein